MIGVLQEHSVVAKESRMLQQQWSSTESSGTDSHESGEADRGERQGGKGAVVQACAGIPQELLAKHPLQYVWTLWYCKAEKGKDWEECLKAVTSFDSVEDFWSLYNHIQLASGLPLGSDYYLFKQGIQPMWEDPQNVKGGRWLIQVDRQRRHQLIDHYWLELLLAVIGEQFDELGEQVCGAVVNVRAKGDKVSLWTRGSQDLEQLRRMGQVVKQKLGLEGRRRSILFEVHADTKQKTGSSIKAILEL